MNAPSPQNLVGSFASASHATVNGAVRKPRKRPPPFSLRLTYEERARLDAAAGNLPLATYIKGRLFEDLPSVPRQRKPSKMDRDLITRTLGKLGQSDLSSSMKRLSDAAHNGSLPLTPDLEVQLKQACADISDLRRGLLNALGMKG